MSFGSAARNTCEPAGSIIGKQKTRIATWSICPFRFGGNHRRDSFEASNFFSYGIRQAVLGESFGRKFKDWYQKANLPHCSVHGLRHATATRLADRGCTPHEIMAITGHRTLAEVEGYTRTAAQSKLADSAMAKLNRRNEAAN
jgi:integrase